MLSSVWPLDPLPSRSQVGGDGVPPRPWQAQLRLSGPSGGSFDPRQRIDRLVRRLAAGTHWPEATGPIRGEWTAPQLTLRNGLFEWPESTIEDRAWRRYLDGLGSDFGSVQLESFTGVIFRGSSVRVPETVGWKIVVDWEQATHNYRRVSVSVWFGEGRDALERSAGFLVDVLRDWTQGEPGLWTGSVSVEKAPFSFDLMDLLFRGADRDRWVDGYYWAQVLMPSHLGFLGGAERVVADAPVAETERIESPAGEAVLCWLTESPDAQTVDAMRAWSEFLFPVLAPGVVTSRDLPTTHRSDRLDGTVFMQEPEPRFLFAGPTPHHEVCGLIRKGVTYHENLSEVVVEWPSLDVDDEESFEAFEDSVGDPEAPTVWIHPGNAFDRERDEDLLFAHVDLWAQFASAGMIDGTDATVDSMSKLLWLDDDTGRAALTFQFTFTGDPITLLERLALAVQGYRDDPPPARHQIDIDIEHISIH